MISSYLANLKQKFLFDFQNLTFENIGHLLRTELESKVERVESISYDSLRVSRVEKFRLTLNTNVKSVWYFTEEELRTFSTEYDPSDLP